MRLTELDKLLAGHQAIIDSWFADWSAKQKERADALWEKHRKAGLAKRRRAALAQPVEKK